MNRFVRFSNALFIIILMSVIASAYYEQYHYSEKPCPLCMIQRLAMFGVAFGAILNLKFGIKPAHYGLSLLFVTFGRTVALRQIALHVCPGFPGFGVPVFGLSLYTWAFIVFYCSAIAIAIFLFLCPKESETPKLNWFEKSAIGYFFVMALSNFITTFIQCGFGPCEDVPWPGT